MRLQIEVSLNRPFKLRVNQVKCGWMLGSKYTIEIKQSTKAPRSRDYAFTIPFAIHELLIAESHAEDLSFCLQMDRDLIYLENRYAELVLSQPVPFEYTQVRLSLTARPLPGPILKGDVLFFTVKRSPR